MWCATACASCHGRTTKPSLVRCTDNSGHYHLFFF
ncbi:EAST1 family heat-stable enterotoxin [Escherichia coli]